MNQMGCYAKRLSQLFVFFDMPQHLRRGDVAVPADQRVVVRVFAELPYTGGEDDQFAAVGHGHTRAIDAFVADPRTAKLFGIEINDGFVYLTVEHGEVCL